MDCVMLITKDQFESATGRVYDDVPLGIMRSTVVAIAKARISAAFGVIFNR